MRNKGCISELTKLNQVICIRYITFEEEKRDNSSKTLHKWKERGENMQKIRQGKTVFLGDSITEGYGVNHGECWVDYMPGDTVNHGISGDTTGGMYRRFAPHVLREKPARVVIMGGVNDLSEGLPLQLVQDNLAGMYRMARQHGIESVTAVCVRPDYDELLYNEWADYYPAMRSLPQRFAQLADWIRDISDRERLLCLDFAREFPKRITDDYGRYFMDGLHPNARGHRIMADIALETLY